MKIEILEYNPDWVFFYKEEEKLIEDVFKELLFDKRHIGGTAVKGLSSRPIIDIMVMVWDINKVEDIYDSLESKGYEYFGSLGLPGRIQFRKKGDKVSYCLDILSISDTHNIKKRLALKEFLINNETERSFYSALKQSLADIFPFDIEGYNIGKSAYIKDLELKALSWFGEGK